MFGKPLPEIDVKTLAEKLRSKEEFVLLDVREDDELLRAKISDTRMLHLPLSRLASQGVAALPESVRSPDRKVYIICHHGSRSMQVTSWLLKSGLGNVINVRGGIDAYAREVDRSVGLY